MNRGIANCSLLFNTGEFNSAVAHEIGHTLAFRHSDQNRSSSAACSSDPTLQCSSTAIMKSFVSSGLNGALQAWDIYAVQAVYPGGSCGGTRVKGDFNADSRSDLVWRNTPGGLSTIWMMNGINIGPGSGTTALNMPSPWQVGGVGDLNGNGLADLVWRNPNTGENVLWLMSGTAPTSGSGSLLTLSTAWTLAGVGDFNGDTRDDLVWRNQTTGQTLIWLMSGTTILSGSGGITSLNPPWQIAGVGDFNADGRADILWRNSSTGQTSIFFMNGTTLSSSSLTALQISAAWFVAAVGDFNGDGRSDIVWRNISTGQNVMWLMNGAATMAGSGTMQQIPDTNWNVGAVGDFNGDGRSDLAWRNNSSGVSSIWLMNGTLILPGSGTLLNVPPPWIIAGPGPRSH